MFRRLREHPDVKEWERGADRIRIVDHWFVEMKEKMGEQ